MWTDILEEPKRVKYSNDLTVDCDLTLNVEEGKLLGRCKPEMACLVGTGLMSKWVKFILIKLPVLFLLGIVEQTASSLSRCWKQDKEILLPKLNSEN